MHLIGKSLEIWYAILTLSRWRQHVPYTLPLVIIGALLTNQLIDWRLLPVVIANILAMTFAFMINDVIDAPDDARDSEKGKRNIISAGGLSYRAGLIISGMMFVVSSGLYAMGGLLSFIVGLSTLILCYLYSVPPVRLKARPIVDVLSHVLMLSALLMVSGYVTYSSNIGSAWWVIAGVTFASAYGQFYNQYADFDVDSQAGLRNTAILLGKQLTYYLSLLCAVLTVVCIGIAMFLGLFPSWLGWVLLITVFTLSLFQWDTDMRGNQADSDGAIQQPVLITANIIAFIWLLNHLTLIPTA